MYVLVCLFVLVFVNVCDGDDGDGEVMITGEKCNITCSSDRQLHQGGAEAGKGDAEEDSAKVFNRF